MDDHMYEMILDYGDCDLIPRIQEEYDQRGSGHLQECPSYEEMVDFCKVLSIVGKWSGYTPVSPLTFVSTTSE